jgi:hypothetical protein
VNAEKCICGGSCAEVVIACLDCAQKWNVPPSHAGTFEALHLRQGHAVSVTHTASRTHLSDW